jgi:hypothetical protein
MPRSRGSIVGIATGYGLDDRGVGVKSLKGQELSLLHSVQTGSGVHSTSYSVGTGGSFPGGKAVKKMWMYTSTPPYIFMA